MHHNLDTAPSTKKPTRLRRRLLKAAAAVSLSAGALSAAAAAIHAATRSDALRAAEPALQGNADAFASFEAYLEETRRMIRARRRFATNNRAAELLCAYPFEERPPAGTPVRGVIVAIHGLGDSPWTWRDPARVWAKAGWVVRAILLPGHGTKPEDMLTLAPDAWLTISERETRRAARDFPGLPLWLAGFSTGGDLAIAVGAHAPAVAGLILVSPAVRIRTKLWHLVGIADWFVDWLFPLDRSPGSGVTPFRYSNVPVPGLATYVASMRAAQRTVEEGGPIKKPVVALLAEHDTIVDTDAVARDLAPLLVHPASRILWVGEREPELEGLELPDARSLVSVRTDHVPAMRVRSFSHLCFTYSPENPEYGIRGRSRSCSRRLPEDVRERCRTSDDVWFGSWREKRDREDGRLYARLTFNPYFDDMMAEILRVLEAQ